MQRIRGFSYGPLLRVGGAMLLSASLSCAPRIEVSSPAAARDSDSLSKKQSPGLLSQGRSAERDGKFREAIAIFERAQDQKLLGAEQALGELYLLTGQYAQVETFLGSSVRSQAYILRAEAFRRQGRIDEALQLLTKKGAQEPKSLVSWERQILRASLLLEQGKRSEARDLLAPLVEKASGGALSAQPAAVQARGWSLAGRAAQLLRYHEDANHLFNGSEKLHEADFELLLWRGELFVDKFDFSHAGQLLEELKKLAPHHPDLQIFAARYHLARALSFDDAEALAKQVLSTNPRSTKARALLAGIELRDLNIGDAEKEISRGLQVNPRDLQLLSLQATARFLAEDPTGFEEIVTQVLELSPGYAELFSVVGEYAEWEHRYPDVERLMRRASRLDRENGKIRALLGLTLVRAGSDAAGIVELQRSFELDPFNLRVFNTLDLYEKIIPEEYLNFEEGPFRFRFPKEEAALLRRYVPDLLKKAHAQMVKRYNYHPQEPIGIEIYADKEHFAVRTSGLARTAIQGVCFGRKLATVSPVGAPGNLGMTLWHELAHVFHIGLSKNRVPRWYTEGLAEWETAHRGVGWSRELDLSLYQAQKAQRLPHLGTMSRAFTRARRMEDVATAYYASGKIVDWVMETRGEARAVSLLKELGEKRLPNEVFPEGLEATFQDLEEEFQRWLQKDLSRFAPQFVSRAQIYPSSSGPASTDPDPQDPESRLSLALGLLSEGRLKKAQKELTKILAQSPLQEASPSSPVDNESTSLHATFALARIFLAREKKEEAVALLQGALSRGYEGFELRMMLARLLLSARKEEEADKQLLRATELDPLDSASWGLLAAIRHRKGDAEQELEALRHLARLEEHDPSVHRRLLRALLDQGHRQEAAQAADLAIWVDLAGIETHTLAALAFLRAGKTQRAHFERESALLCPASEAQKKKYQDLWETERTNQ